LGRTGPTTTKKSALTSDDWRGKFKVVYERDQCLPGAFFAVLTSADLLFGTKVTSVHTMGDLNKKLGYRKGAATPAEALEKPGFGRWLRGFGLEVHWERGSPKAYDNVEESTRRDDVSFSLVEVDLQFVLDYDPNTTVTGSSFPSDHAIVVLKIANGEVEFFDPTFNSAAVANVKTKQVVSTVQLVKRWSECKDPYYRVWVTRPSSFTAKKMRREGLRGVPPLSRWRQKGGGVKL